MVTSSLLFGINKMPIVARENYIGAVAFLIGVILSVIVGISTSSFLPISFLVSYSSQIYAILVLLGLFIGFFINVSGKNSRVFLNTGVILVIVSSFGMENIKGSLIGIGVGEIISSIFTTLLILFVPATIIVALKTLFSMSKI